MKFRLESRLQSCSTQLRCSGCCTTTNLGIAEDLWATATTCKSVLCRTNLQTISGHIWAYLISGHISYISHHIWLLMFGSYCHRLDFAGFPWSWVVVQQGSAWPPTSEMLCPPDLRGGCRSTKPTHPMHPPRRRSPDWWNASLRPWRPSHVTSESGNMDELKLHARNSRTCFLDTNLHQHPIFRVLLLNNTLFSICTHCHWVKFETSALEGFGRMVEELGRDWGANAMLRASVRVQLRYWRTINSYHLDQRAELGQLFDFRSMLWKGGRYLYNGYIGCYKML